MHKSNLAELVLGGGQQTFPFPGAFVGQRGVAAADQPLAGVVGVRDLGEVLRVEQRHLQRPAVGGQGGDGGRSHPPDPSIGAPQARPGAQRSLFEEAAGLDADEAASRQPAAWSIAWVYHPMVLSTCWCCATRRRRQS
jgi:hypothetical protein